MHLPCPLVHGKFREGHNMKSSIFVRCPGQMKICLLRMQFEVVVVNKAMDGGRPFDKGDIRILWNFFLLFSARDPCGFSHGVHGLRRPGNLRLCAGMQGLRLCVGVQGLRLCVGMQGLSGGAGATLAVTVRALHSRVVDSAAEIALYSQYHEALLSGCS